MSDSSYAFSEATAENGMPALCIDFYCANSREHWPYTTAPYKLYLDRWYESQPGLKDGPLALDGNALRTTWDLTVPYSCPFLAEYVGSVPPGIVTVTAWRGHCDASEDYQTPGLGVPGAGIGGGHTWHVYWRGVVLTPEWGSNNAATIKCAPTASHLGLGGMCPRFGRQCQVPLYSTPCGVDRDDYQATGTITAVSSDTVTAVLFGAAAADYYLGGEFQAADGTQRLIVDQSGSVVTLTRSIASLAVGQTFKAWPGCDHIWASDCDTRFGNKLAFRGQAQMIDTNPFTESTY